MAAGSLHWSRQTPCHPSNFYTAGFCFPGQTPVSPVPSVLLIALTHLCCSSWFELPLAHQALGRVPGVTLQKRGVEKKDPGVCPIGNRDFSARIEGFQAPRTVLNVRLGKRLTSLFLPVGHKWAQWVRRGGWVSSGHSAHRPFI